jgi:hypothetical protein
MESMTTRRPSLFGGVTAVAGVGAVVAGLALFDERVRVHIGQVVSGNPPTGQMVSLGEQVQDFIAIAMQAVRDQSIEHTPLVVFAVAAAVLFVFMTRT